MRNQVKFSMGIIILLFVAAGCTAATVEPTAVPAAASGEAGSTGSNGSRSTDPAWWPPPARRSSRA